MPMYSFPVASFKGGERGRCQKNETKVILSDKKTNSSSSSLDKNKASL